MSDILIFNPENDLALAADCVAFTPPVAATQLRYAGELLPVWMANDGDFIMVEKENFKAATSLAESLGISITPLDRRKSDLSEFKDFRIRPWGWNRALLHDLRRRHVARLPEERDIDHMRRLSSRELTVEINRRLDRTHLHSTPRCIQSTDEAMSVITDCGGNVVVKLPWSSSGRGVFSASDFSESKLIGIIDGAIRRQGAVMIERKLAKKTDCAALFYHRYGSTEFEFKGLSLFFNERFSSYAGNVIAQQNEIEQSIADLVGENVFRDTIRELTPILKELLLPDLSWYDGWLGVDMLVHESGGKFMLAPCIEVNLRSTMGVVAMKVAQRLNNVTGQFIVADSSHAIPTDAIDLSPVKDPRFRFLKI